LLSIPQNKDDTPRLNTMLHHICIHDPFTLQHEVDPGMLVVMKSEVGAENMPVGLLVRVWKWRCPL